MRTSMKGAVAALAVSSLCSGVHGQEVSEKVLESTQTPNEIETSIGTLRLRLGKQTPISPSGAGIGRWRNHRELHEGSGSRAAHRHTLSRRFGIC